MKVNLKVYCKEKSQNRKKYEASPDFTQNDSHDTLSLSNLRLLLGDELDFLEEKLENFSQLITYFPWLEPILPMQLQRQIAL